MSNVKEKTNVLLQTATAYAYGEDKTKKVTVNILFDGGSKKSFVSEELKCKLDLKSEKTEVLNHRNSITRRLAASCDIADLRRSKMVPTVESVINQHEQTTG